MKKFNFSTNTLPENFHWFNEPASFTVDEGLALSTKPKTDFWQRTHYGFRRDDGHCLLTEIKGDFSIETRTEFTHTTQYDQCGLIIRADNENWIKCSSEYENKNISRLGSVVTNLGFSDWATQDIPSTIKSISYRITKTGNDFLLENSFDESIWNQMRITHLHKCPDIIEAGIYACSPVGSKFRCKFNYISISDSKWHCA